MPMSGWGVLLTFLCARVAAQCSGNPSIANLDQISTCDGTANGKSCSFNCKDGFRASGVASCLDNVWVAGPRCLGFDTMSISDELSLIGDRFVSNPTYCVFTVAAFLSFFVAIFYWMKTLRAVMKTPKTLATRQNFINCLTSPFVFCFVGLSILILPGSAAIFTILSAFQVRVMVPSFMNICQCLIQDGLKATRVLSKAALLEFKKDVDLESEHEEELDAEARDIIVDHGICYTCGIGLLTFGGKQATYVPIALASLSTHVTVQYGVGSEEYTLMMDVMTFGVATSIIIAMVDLLVVWKHMVDTKVVSTDVNLTYKFLPVLCCLFSVSMLPILIAALQKEGAIDPLSSLFSIDNTSAVYMAGIMVILNTCAMWMMTKHGFTDEELKECSEAGTIIMILDVVGQCDEDGDGKISVMELINNMGPDVQHKIDALKQAVLERRKLQRQKRKARKKKKKSKGKTNELAAQSPKKTKTKRKTRSRTKRKKAATLQSKDSEPITIQVTGETPVKAKTKTKRVKKLSKKKGKKVAPKGMLGGIQDLFDS